MLLPGDEEQLDYQDLAYLRAAPSPLWLLLKIFAFVFGLCFIMISVAGFFFIRNLELGPGIDEGLAAIANWQAEDNSLVYDRNGKEIAAYFSEDHVFVPYDEVPKTLFDAIIAIEDRKFWTHHGVDYRGILRALYANLSSPGSYAQGGSTITQQVVRHFLLERKKTLERKFLEIYLALRLEGVLDKKKILEIYANKLFLGNGAYGAGAAAKRYFGLPLNELKLHQLALIAGLFQSPSRYNPERNPKGARARQLLVLRALYETGQISDDEYVHWRKQKLQYQFYDSNKNRHARHFVDHVHEQLKTLLPEKTIKNGGLRVYTTLDSQLQTLAEQSIKKGIAEENLPEKIEAALLSVNPKKGDILAMVGGRNYGKSQFNRCTQAKRQPGSLFKPIVYSLALEKGFRWSDVIYVSPLTLDGNYRPKSSKSDYMKETTLLRAFYRSMNSPTMELGEKLGVSSILRHARNLGVSTPIKREFGSLLGSSETSILELATVYSTFARMGRRVEPFAIERVETRSGELLYQHSEEKGAQVLSPGVAYLMIEGMRQVLLRGTGTNFAHLGKWAVGKTGTSNLSVDSWFAGFSPDLLAIVWVGPDQPEPMDAKVQGSTVALPIWAKFMERALPSRPEKNFPMVDGLLTVDIDPEYGTIAKGTGVPMWFLPDHGPIEKAGTAKIKAEQSYRDPFAKK